MKTLLFFTLLVLSFGAVEAAHDGASVANTQRGKDTVFVSIDNKETYLPGISESDVITVLFKKGTVKKASLFDETGRPIRQWPTWAFEEAALYIPNISPGVYLLRYQTQDGMGVTHKITIGR